jgi:hypothetical protein
VFRPLSALGETITVSTCATPDASARWNTGDSSILQVDRPGKSLPNWGRPDRSPSRLKTALISADIRLREDTSEPTKEAAKTTTGRLGPLRSQFLSENFNPTTTTSLASHFSAPPKPSTSSLAHGSRTAQRGKSISSVTASGSGSGHPMGSRNAYLDGTGAPPEAWSQKQAAYSPPGSLSAVSQGLPNTIPTYSFPAMTVLQNIPRHARLIERETAIPTHPSSAMTVLQKIPH